MAQNPQLAENPQLVFSKRPETVSAENDDRGTSAARRTSRARTS